MLTRLPSRASAAPAILSPQVHQTFKCHHDAQTCTCTFNHPTHAAGGCRQFVSKGGVSLDMSGDCGTVFETTTTAAPTTTTTTSAPTTTAAPTAAPTSAPTAAPTTTTTTTTTTTPADCSASCVGKTRVGGQDDGQPACTANGCGGYQASNNFLALGHGGCTASVTTFQASNHGGCCDLSKCPAP